MTTPVDTGTAEHRKLRFQSSAQMWAEIDRIVAAARAGRLRRTGNWEAGQILNHLAAWASFPYDGYPAKLNPPWFVRLLMKGKKKKYLYDGLPAGVRIPGVEGGTAATEPTSLDEGLARMRKAWDRLDRSPPTSPNPLFGPMSHDEWKAVHLRHAELHLGFLHPE